MSNNNNNNDKRLDELQKKIDSLANRVENLKCEIDRRQDRIFVSSIPDDHIPVDHYW